MVYYYYHRAANALVQFSSVRDGINLCARKSPYALYPGVNVAVERAPVFVSEIDEALETV